MILVKMVLWTSRRPTQRQASCNDGGDDDVDGDDDDDVDDDDDDDVDGGGGGNDGVDDQVSHLSHQGGQFKGQLLVEREPTSHNLEIFQVDSMEKWKIRRRANDIFAVQPWC